MDAGLSSEGLGEIHIGDGRGTHSLLLMASQICTSPLLVPTDR